MPVGAGVHCATSPKDPIPHEAGQVNVLTLHLATEPPQTQVAAANPQGPLSHGTRIRSLLSGQTTSTCVSAETTARRIATVNNLVDSTSL